MNGSEELRAYATNLGRIGLEVAGEVDKVLKRGAQNIKTGLQENLRESKHFRQVAASISYDQIGDVRALGYEVGPDKERHAGALANVAFFGTSRGGGTVDFEGPLREEEPRLVGYLQELLGRMGGDL